MKIIQAGVGTNDNVQVQVDQTHKASRLSVRPNELGVYGSYRKALKSGVIAAGSSTALNLWEFRWGQASVIALIKRLKVQVVVSTTGFSAIANAVNQGQESNLLLYRAQGFTVLDGTNAVTNPAAFLKGKSAANATRMSPSQLANGSTLGGIVILNTSNAGLTGGTKTLDDDPIHTLFLNGTNSTALAAEKTMTQDPPPLMIDPSEIGRNPIELNINEGLVLQVDTIPGTGTFRVAVEVDWDEVDPARYF